MQARLSLQMVTRGGGNFRRVITSFFNHGIRTGTNSVLFCGLGRK